jgi:sugar phosphate isomerase/epimerase
MGLPIGICSFSFHRLLAAGKQDIFQFILDCKELGCTQLDPWNAHLSPIRSGDDVITAGHNPNASGFLTAADEDYIDLVRRAGDAVGLPFGAIAVDGAHIYEPDPEARAANRARAYKWLDVAHKLGAKQVRIDCGGPEELPDDVLEIIIDGYRDIIDRAGEKSIQVLIENHWGPSVLPENVIKLLDNIPGLGFLFDTHNWREDRKQDAWKMCAHYASAMHVKTFDFDAEGNPVGEDPTPAIQLLMAAGYSGAWGVESVPEDGDEIAGAKKTIDLIYRTVQTTR